MAAYSIAKEQRCS